MECRQDEIFSRSRGVLGADGSEKLACASAAVFGTGGVGGWCAEALVRTGMGGITIVDCDTIAPSNINRQIMADPASTGEYKVEVLAARLGRINPSCRVTSVKTRFCAETAAAFDLSEFDVVIDAIDSVADKCLLVKNALEAGKPALFSSMGAAFRRDPLKVRTADFTKIEGDALARAMRRTMRKEGFFPPKPFTCVYSSEQPSAPDVKGVKGSLVQVTAVFGMVLASLAVEHVCNGGKTSRPVADARNI